MRIKITDDLLKKIISEEIKNCLRESKENGRLFEEKDYKYNVMSELKNSVIEELNKIGENNWSIELVDKPSDPSKKKYDDLNKIFRIELKGGKAGYSFIIKWKTPDKYTIIPSVPLKNDSESIALYDYISNINKKGKNLIKMLERISPTLKGITKFPTNEEKDEEESTNVSQIAKDVKTDIKKEKIEPKKEINNKDENIESKNINSDETKNKPEEVKK